jgi:hypothetical protein
VVTSRLADELADVAAGLVAGARYVLARRGPRAALGATGGFSLFFGPLFLLSILLYRNYFYPGHVTVAEGHVVILAVVSAVGYFCAALITPLATRRLPIQAWITLMLLLAAVVAATLGETFIEIAYLAVGFFMYLTRQGVAICATTILQEQVEDAYRGRVFAFYDMMFNATYVAGAALFAAFMPDNGRSPVIVAVAAIGFALVAAGYWLFGGRNPSVSAQRNSASAARS